MTTHFGPAINAFQHSSPDAQQQLTEEMTGLIQEFNRSPNTTILSDSEYLGIVATRGLHCLGDVRRLDCSRITGYPEIEIASAHLTVQATSLTPAPRYSDRKGGYCPPPTRPRISPLGQGRSSPVKSPQKASPKARKPPQLRITKRKCEVQVEYASCGSVPILLPIWPIDPACTSAAGPMAAFRS